MDLNLAKQALLDEVVTGYCKELQQDPAAANTEVQLAYAQSIQQRWRTALRMLPVSSTWSVLDIGCGAGILSFELAANLPLSVHGIDIDPAFISDANVLLERLSEREYFADGAMVRFTEGDVMSLQLEDSVADMAFVREILQFVSNPQGAVDEVFRVVKPGGFACVSDIDDQLYITWPPGSEAQERLLAAFRSLHRQRGGDRQSGRKLSTYLSNSGFEIVSIVVLPEAHHRIVDSSDAERTLVVSQLKAARSMIIETSKMTASEFDSDIESLENETAHPEFRMNARIIVLARKSPI